MMSVFRKLSWLFRRQRKERDLLDEISFHLSEDTEERESDGLSAENARRTARLQFGNVAVVQEDVRSAWSWLVLDQLWQDLCYAARGFRRAPAFTAGAVAVLAVGIGANLALLQIFDSVFVHRYSFPNADSFVRFDRVSNDRFVRTFPWTAFDFYRDRANSFASLVLEDKSFTVVVDANSEQRATFVSDNYFSVVSIVPALGRVFGLEDFRPGAPAVTLVTNQYWRTHLGADRDVLGRVIHVNNVALEVVGVLPADFGGFSVVPTGLWFPSNSRTVIIHGRPSGEAELFGQLKTGESLASGMAGLTTLTRELAREQPRLFNKDDRIRAEPVQDSMIHFLITRSPVFVIFIGMVALVLLSASAHLGNMLLVRGLSRQHEFSIRMAIGAGRNRLIWQLVTENALLAVLGSAAGMALGLIAARLILISLSRGTPFRVSLHGQTLAACVAMTFVSIFVFGLPAAREMTRAGFQTSSLRSRLVGNQVAISCVLLIVSGTLAARGRLNASLDLTSDYRRILLVDPQLKEVPPEAAQLSLDKLVTSISSLPGVKTATITTAVPLRGRVVDNFPRWPRVHRSAVSPEYFNVMRQAVLHGRTFLSGETDVVIASESAVRALWPNQNPLGQIWTVGGMKRTVVGVLQDSWTGDFNPGTIEAYIPITSRDVQQCFIIVQTYGDPASVLGLIPRAAASVDEAVSVTPMTTMLDSIREAGAGPAATVIGGLGLVATALAAAGMSALIAFTVIQRKREIGIRVAIGAKPRDIVFGLLTVHAKPLAVGLLKGAIAGTILLLVLRAVVSPERYIVIFGGLALGLAAFSAVAALATIMPALRALRIDVSKALRTD